MKKLSAEELRNLLDTSRDVHVVNVLSPKHFRERRIPSSLNVPVDSDEFERDVELAIGGRTKRVVVYSADSTCPKAPDAADRLEEAGFTNVFLYEGGVQDWIDAAMPVDVGPPPG